MFGEMDALCDTLANDSSAIRADTIVACRHNSNILANLRLDATHSRGSTLLQQRRNDWLNRTEYLFSLAGDDIILQ